MNIVVLVKIVPDIEKVTFNVENGTVNRASAPQEINPFDLNALEEAVKIKEEEAGGRVIVVCMGPP
ncbi:MAG TPA: electron transfer flavoprotein, beta subunit, partial [Thermosynergistes sp.]|nr:electron transfer flavoprotein, beta subunit [Thermosynergistes sp.]